MAGESMFEALEEFRIIDIDQVILNTPNYKAIPEPSGFDILRLRIERDINDRGGTNFEFGNSESILGFDRHEQAYQTINLILDAKGTDANIGFEYYQTINNTNQLIYTGLIIPSSKEEFDFENKFRVKRTDYGDKLRTRYDVENAIDSNKDLDGNDIVDFPLIDLPLHSKTIVKEGIQNVDGPIFFDDPIPSTTQNFSPGTLWGFAGFNDTERSLEGLIDNGEYFEYREGGFVTGGGFNQDKFVDSNPLVEQGLYKYRSTANQETVNINIRHVFSILLDTQGVAIGSTVGNFDEIKSYSMTLWAVSNRTTLKEIVHEFFATPIGFSSHGPTVDVSFSGDVNLSQGDEIYYAFDYSLGGTVNSQAVRFQTRQILNQQGFFIITSNSRAKASLCKGQFIYDALNRLVKKAVGTTGVGELTLYYTGLTNSFTTGEIVRGGTSNAKGRIFSQSSSLLRLLDVEGSFISGESITGLAGVATVSSFDVGSVNGGLIVKSSILEKEEEGSLSDGCGSLNFVTNGFAIRGFINREYNADRFYKKGDKVKSNGVDYIYINDTITNGNAPPNATYWKVQEGRKITSSIKKIVDFVKARYGAGFAVIRENGSGTGGFIGGKLTRVLIEKQSYFFQDKLIASLSSIESLNKKVNKELIVNEVKTGFKIYAEENQEGSLNGFNTIREYLSPIAKDKGTLDLTANASADGFEIERLRRLSLGENPEESDEKDDETFIIKCQRHNSTNPIRSVDITNESGASSVTTNSPSGGTFVYKGLFIGDYIDQVTSFTHSTAGLNGTFSIDSISYDFEQNRTTIVTLDSGVSSGSSGTYEIYFNIDVFLPERLQGFSNVANTIDSFTEYNIDHTPSNFLIENFAWLGSGLRAKQGSEEIRFTFGKNNVFFEKQYDSNSCFPNTSLTLENQNFSLSALRSWNPAFFNEYVYEIKTYLNYEEFERIRKALINESTEDINFGYIEFLDNNNITTQAFPFSLEYDPKSFLTNIVAWGKA